MVIGKLIHENSSNNCESLDVSLQSIGFVLLTVKVKEILMFIVTSS